MGPQVQEAREEIIRQLLIRFNMKQDVFDDLFICQVGEDTVVWNVNTCEVSSWKLPAQGVAA